MRSRLEVTREGQIAATGAPPWEYTLNSRFVDALIQTHPTLQLESLEERQARVSKIPRYPTLDQIFWGAPDLLTELKTKYVDDPELLFNIDTIRFHFAMASYPETGQWPEPDHYDMVESVPLPFNLLKELVYLVDGHRFVRFNDGSLRTFAEFEVILRTSVRDWIRRHQARVQENLERIECLMNAPEEWQEVEITEATRTSAAGDYALETRRICIYDESQLERYSCLQNKQILERTLIHDDD